MDGRFDLPEGLSREEERSVMLALERYFLRESPRTPPWVLAARIETTGYGALQARKYAESSWPMPGRVGFARSGVPSLVGRADAR